MLPAPLVVRAVPLAADADRVAANRHPVAGVVLGELSIAGPPVLPWVVDAPGVPMLASQLWVFVVVFVGLPWLLLLVVLTLVDVLVPEEIG
jgi:hypothetical protein